MKFRWLSPRSDVAAATMVVARSFFKGVSIEKAIEETLHNGELCHFPDLMPERERIRFQLMIDEMIKKTEDERRKNRETIHAVVSHSPKFQGRSRIHA